MVTTIKVSSETSIKCVGHAVSWGLGLKAQGFRLEPRGLGMRVQVSKTRKVWRAFSGSTVPRHLVNLLLGLHVGRTSSRLVGNASFLLRRFDQVQLHDGRLQQRLVHPLNAGTSRGAVAVGLALSR